MPSLAHCERCAAPLDPAVSGGLCAACLTRLAQASWLDPLATSPPTIPLQEGEETSPSGASRPRLFGDYELIEEIARGGMGIVFKARQRSLNRVVAVKMIRAGVLASELDIARFEAEARAAAGLQHPNIIAIHEVGQHDDRHYFSMEYVEGRNLSTCVREHPWPAPRAAHCLETVAGAVDYAHQRGILHRDLKPSNVILDEAGTPHLTDFGLATRIEEASALTLSGVILGTPSYMAPEQTGGRTAEIGPVTDVYALGALLYEVLTGRPPFQGETPLETIKQVRDTDPVSPRRLNPNVPTDLETICLKCLEKEPKRRYATARELAEDLRRFLSHEPIHARPVKAWEHGLKWIRRNPWRAALAGAMSIAVLTGVGFALERGANRELRQVVAKLKTTEAELSLALDASRAAHQQERLHRERAETAEQQASAALKDLRKARDAAMRSDYLRRIAEANQALEANNVAEAERLLAHCPEDLRQWEWRYLKRLAHPEVARYALATNGVQQIALSADGTRAAAVDGSGRIHSLNLVLGSTTVMGGFSNRTASAIAIPSSGPSIILGMSHDGGSMCAISNPFDSDPDSFSEGCFAPRSLVLTRDDRSLLQASDDELSCWDSEQGMRLRWRVDPPLDSIGLAISIDRIGSAVAWIIAPANPILDPNGKSLGHRGNAVQIHAVRDGALLRRLEEDLDDVRAVALSSTRPRRLATGHGDGRIRLWSITTGELEGTLPGHTGPVLTVAFSDDDRRLASGGVDRAVRVWSVAVAGVSSVFRGHRGEIRQVGFTHAGNRVIAAGMDGSVRVWDPDSPVQSWQVPAEGSSLAFLDNDRLVLGTGSIRSAETGHELLNLDTGHTHGRVVVDKEGGRIVVNNRVFKETAGEFHATAWSTFHGARSQIASAGLNGDGNILAHNYPSKSEGLRVGLFQLNDGLELHPLLISKNDNAYRDVYDLGFSPDGDFLAVATGSWSRSGMQPSTDPGQVQLWDWRTAQLIHTLTARRFCVWATAFTPDGNRLVTSGGLYMQGPHPHMPPHGEIQVWDVETGCELFDLQGVSDNVFGIAISPDGMRLAAATGKIKGRTIGEVKLWDLETGAEVLTLRGFPGPAHGVAFSPNGKRLAALGGGTLKIWSIE